MIKKFWKLLLWMVFFIPSLAFASPSQVDFLLSGFTDSSGIPLSGGKVYTYIAGTTTNKTTWSNLAGTSAHANPIILDSNGKKQVFADGLYKFVVTDSSDTTLYTWDNLSYGVATGVTTNGGTSSGAANVYEITIAPSPVSYAVGQKFSFISHQANTTAATINVSAIGSVAITSKTDQTLVGGEIPNAAVVTVQYDGNSFRLVQVSPIAQVASVYSSTLDSLSGAATTLNNMTATIKVKTGDYVRISWWATMQANNTGTECDLQVYENGVAIASTLSHYVTTGDVGSTGDGHTMSGSFLLTTPTAGTIPYTLKGARSTGANVCYYHYKGLNVEAISP